MTICLVGSSGRLGQALANTFPNDKIKCLESTVYRGWCHGGHADSVSKFFESTTEAYSTVLIASGLLDPSAPSEDLISINYVLPRNIIEGATKVGLKVITFGTVMEEILNSQNSYVHSKTLLSDYIRSLSAVKSSVAHIQLHTLYGIGQPSPFMFLGQILNAIINDIPFKMTSGNQLREYHHFLDDAVAIENICCSEITGVVNLSHGCPVSLSEIAEHVFESFGKYHLLEKGALLDPIVENYDKVFLKLSEANDVSFRDTLPAIVAYLEACRSSKVLK